MGDNPETSRFFVYIGMVYFCYIDESGTPQVPGNTSHYVLCGVSIPVKFWKKCNRTINSIKRRYGLEDAEIHTGWIAYIPLKIIFVIIFLTLQSLFRKSDSDCNEIE